MSWITWSNIETLQVWFKYILKLKKQINTFLRDIKLIIRESSIYRYLLSVQQSWLQYCSAQYIGPPCKKKSDDNDAYIMKMHNAQMPAQQWIKYIEAVKESLTCVLSEGEWEPCPPHPLLTWEHSENTAEPQTWQPNKWKGESITRHTSVFIS